MMDSAEFDLSLDGSTDEEREMLSLPLVDSYTDSPTYGIFNVEEEISFGRYWRKSRRWCKKIFCNKAVVFILSFGTLATLLTLLVFAFASTPTETCNYINFMGKPVDQNTCFTYNSSTTNYRICEGSGTAYTYNVDSGKIYKQDGNKLGKYSNDGNNTVFREYFSSRGCEAGDAAHFRQDNDGVYKVKAIGSKYEYEIKSNPITVWKDGQLVGKQNFLLDYSCSNTTVIVDEMDNPVIMVNGGCGNIENGILQLVNFVPNSIDMYVVGFLGHLLSN